MARRIAELVGRVMVEDRIHGVLGNPRFCVTLDLGHNKIHTLELANVSTCLVVGLVEYELEDRHHQNSFAWLHASADQQISSVGEAL